MSFHSLTMNLLFRGWKKLVDKNETTHRYPFRSICINHHLKLLKNKIVESKWSKYTSLNTKKLRKCGKIHS